MNINKLLEIEIRLAYLYSSLLKLEASNSILNITYTNTIKTLLNTLDLEDKILYNCNIEELKEIKDFAENNRVESSSNVSIFVNNIPKRLSIKVEKILNILLTKEKVKKENNNLLKTCTLINLVDFEKTDIYLSFLDERIKNTNKFKNKFHLIVDKYIFISELETDNIKRISKRNFQTEESLYLDSLLYTATYGYNEEIYLKVKDIMVKNFLQILNNEIINDELDRQNNTIDLMFRTMMLLLSNEKYKKINTCLCDNEELLDKYIYIFGDDILEKLNKDRQRHKTLCYYSQPR